MPTLRYTFRPSLFTTERTVIVDNTGVREERARGDDRRLNWSDITEVHVEPVPNSADDRARWVLHLRPKGGRSIDVDSVNVRSATEFEQKTDEFVAVLRAVHTALGDRRDVAFLFGPRRGVTIAWRIALFLCFAAGVFGCVAAVMVEQFEVLFTALPFALFGLAGLFGLRGRKGPIAYDASTLADRVKDAEEKPATG